MMLQYTFLFSFVLLLFMGIYIYFFSKKIAHKFFYPALMVFVLFSLVPISYSIYVSFTNLKTGHLLERNDVISIFENEHYIDSSSPELQYTLFKKNNSDDSTLFLLVDNLLAEFKEQDKTIELKSMTKLPEGLRVLTPAEWLELIEDNSMSIKHPLGVYSFFRMDTLVKLKKRFTVQPVTHQSDAVIFKDNITGDLLIEDRSTGQFKTNDQPVGPGYYTWVGLTQYKELFLNPDTKIVFLRSLLWTIAWASISVFLTFFAGAFLAVTLNELKSFSKVIYRAVFILPYSIPFFISVLIFKGMLNKDFGEVNQWLSVVLKSPIPWLEDKWWAKISVLMVNLWLGFPYMLLVITGVIQSIPKSLYEASSLEGASRLQNFRFITLPLVLRSMIPLLVGSFAFNFNNFVGIYLLTGGGPVISEAKTPIGETDILISYTYRLAFEGSQGQNFALASAVAMIIFIIIVVLTLLNFRFSKKVNNL